MENLESLLEHLDITELKELVNDEDTFNNFTKEAAANVDKESDEQKQVLMASNKSLAEFNLGREEDLIEKKNLLKDLNEQIAELSKSIEKKVEQIKSHKNNVSADTVLALLQTAASETEEESEKIPEEFLNGTIDQDKFLETFTSKRILMHLRRIKADKMAEMLTKRNSFGSPAAHNNSGFNNSNISGFNNSNNPSYNGSFNSSFGSHIPYNTPYPVTGTGMPLPNIPMTPYPSIPSMPAPSYNHF